MCQKKKLVFGPLLRESRSACIITLLSKTVFFAQTVHNCVHTVTALFRHTMRSLISQTKYILQTPFYNPSHMELYAPYVV